MPAPPADLHVLDGALLAIAASVRTADTLRHLSGRDRRDLEQRLIRGIINLGGPAVQGPSGPRRGQPHQTKGETMTIYNLAGCACEITGHPTEAGTVYKVSVRTPDGRVYENAFLTLEQAQHDARRWCAENVPAGRRKATTAA